jgi:autotransporter-associated beta strand protein
MKIRSLLSTCALAVLGLLNPKASAATYWWDGDANVALGQSDNTNTAPQFWIGGGLWDDGATSSSTLFSWNPGDSAVFGGSAASQTINADTLTIGNMTFGAGPQGAGTGSSPVYTLTNGAITLSAGSLVTNNTPTTIATALGGTGDLTKWGVGTLTLSGASTYTGNLTINQGLVVCNGAGQYNTLASTGPLGNPSMAGRTVTVNNGGTLRFGGDNQLGGPQTGKQPVLGLVINAGGSVLGFTGGNMNTLGPVTLNGGTLTTDNGFNAQNQSFYLAGSNVTVGGSSPSLINVGGTSQNGVHLASTTTFTVADATGDASPDLTVSAALLNRPSNDSGTGSLVKNGTGTMVLSGASSYTGATTINNGVLSLSNATTFASAVTINAPGTLDLQMGGSGSWTFGNAASGNGALTKSGSGTVTLSAAQTYTGNTTVNGGALMLSSSSASQPVLPAVWLDASATATVHTNAGGEVYQWDNQGVLGGSFAMGTSASAAVHPTYVAGGAAFNNLPAVNFSGASSQCLTNLNVPDTGTQLQVFMVLNRAAVSANSGILSLKKSTDAADWNTTTSQVFQDAGSGSGVTVFRGGSARMTVSALANSTTYVVDYAFDGASCTGFLNGAAQGSAIASTGNFGVNYAAIGCRFLSSGATPAAPFWSGQVAEMVVYTNVLTAAQRQGVETYLARKWSNPVYGMTSLNNASAVSVAPSATFGGAGVAGAVTVNAGGNLAPGQSGAGTLTLSNLTFGGASTFTVSPSNSYVPLDITNALMVNATVTINIANVPALSSTHHLLRFASLAGTGSFVLPPTRNPYTLQINGNYLDLVVGSTTSYPLWTGTQSTEWSTNNIAGAKNWKLNLGGATDFLPNDSVVFNDTTGNTTVDVSVANVAPFSTVFNHTNSNYTLQGSKAIASGTLAKSGSGMLTINNANTYPGGTTLNEGTLKLGNSTALGSGPLTITGGTLDSGVAGLVNANNNAQNWNGDFTFAGTQSLNLGSGTVTLGGNRQVTVSASTLTLGGSLGGTFGLTKAGAGTLLLTGSGIAYSGVTTVSNGWLVLSNATGYKSSTALSGGNLEVAAIGLWGVQPGGMTLTGTGTLLKSGAGVWLVGDTGGHVNFNLSPGSLINIQGGTIRCAFQGTSFGANQASINVAGGATLDLFSESGQMDALTGAGTVINNFAIGGHNVRVGVANGSGTFGGSIMDGTDGVNTVPVSLTKAGTGTQVLSGINTYTGATAITNGALLITSPGSLAATAVTVRTGGTLGGNGTIGGPVSLQSGATLAPGGATAIGTLTLADALTLNTGCTNVFRVAKLTGGVATNDQVAGFTGTLAYAGTLVVTNVGTNAFAVGDTFTLFAGAFNNYSGTFDSLVLPVLPGLNWDTSQLAVNGTISLNNKAATPVFNPATGGYIGAQAVTISCATSNSTIHYTTDGWVTTNTYTGPITVAVNTTVSFQAFATAPNYQNSDPASATYMTEAEAVWLNQLGGSWADGVNWTNNLPANGRNGRARFDTLGLSFDATVSLDGSWTIGHLVFADTNALYNWIVTGATGQTLTLDSTNTPSINVSNQMTTISAVLAGTNGLTKIGNGTLTLSGSNTFTGNLTINQGLVEAASPGQYAVQGATRGALGNPATLGRTVTINNGATLHIGVDNIFGGPQGPAPNLGMVINAGGALTAFSGNMNTLGPVTLNGGTFTTANGFNANNQSFYLKGGNVSAGGASASAITAGETSNNGLHLATNTTFNVADATGDANPDLIVSTALLNRPSNDPGTGALVKTGAGTLLLSATNTYTGATIVSNGTLRVDGSLAAGSAVLVAPAGTLGGTGTVGGAVTILGAVSPGASVGTLTTGAETWYDGSTLIYQVASADTNNPGGRDLLTINGTLDLERTNNGVFTIKLVSMLNSTTPGNVPDFDGSSNYTWTVGTATGLANPGNLSYIVVDASGFSNPHGGTFAPAFDLGSEAILVTYTPAAVNTTPTNLGASLSGTSLTLSWPQDHTGWTLQSQTNSRSIGLTGTWFDVAGSTATNQMTFQVDRTKPTVFYRLVYP